MFPEINAQEVADFANRLSSNIQNIAQNAQREWMQGTVRSIVRVMQEYPPETDANRPPPPYYIRGTGRVLRGGKILFTSGQLGSNWEDSISVSSAEVVGEIRNSTANPMTGNVYSSYVHGAPGGLGRRGEQASFHTRRGWPSLLNVTLAAVGETRATVIYYGGINLEGSPDEIGERIAREIERLG